MKRLLMLCFFSINLLGYNPQGTWPFLFIDFKKVKECYKENISLLKKVEDEKSKTPNSILNKSFTDNIAIKMDAIDKKIHETIKSFAENHECYAIININTYNANSVSYCHDGCDITDEIINILNN